MKILSASGIRKVDAYTIEHEPIESLDLMERAAEKITEAICNRWEQDTPIVVFAGPGNNGGDALAVARMLAEKGYQLDVYLINLIENLSTNCNINKELLETMEQVEFHNITSPFAAPKLTSRHLVIDGLFGSGLNKALSGGYAAVVKFLNASPATIVSIDMPSGLMCEDNSYNVRSNIIRADVTLSLQLPKLAFFFAENAEYVGEWQLLDIGLSQQGIEEQSTNFEYQEESEIQEMIKPRSKFAHKGNFGHALLVAGSKGMAGASILAARACLRSGTGLVTIHTPFCNTAILQATVPEAMVDCDLEENAFAIAPNTDDYQAIGVGPGLGKAQETEMALLEMLQDCQVPCVIDADALNILANNRHMLTNLVAGSILTPHIKELERIIGKCQNSYERLTRTIELAQNTQCYVIIKGAYSTIVTPEGKCYFNPTGNSGMAKGGSGDALTGLLTGLLAQGYHPEKASRLGVYLHGLAGDIACDKFHEISMTATDIINSLPLAWHILSE